jgi:hypothetical protein
MDAARQRVHVRAPKGNKDRFVPLPDATLDLLRRFWRVYRNPVLLFTNRQGGQKATGSAATPLDRGGVKTTLRKVVQACGMKKGSTAPFVDVDAEYILQALRLRLMAARRSAGVFSKPSPADSGLRALPRFAGVTRARCPGSVRDPARLHRYAHQIIPGHDMTSRKTRVGLRPLDAHPSRVDPGSHRIRR